MRRGWRSSIGVLATCIGLLGCKSTDDPTTSSPTTAATPVVPAPPVSSAIARVQVQISMRTSDHLAVLRDVFDGKADAAAVRAFFDPGVTGDAPAAAQFDNLARLAKDGWRVQRYEVRTIRVDDGAARATADVFEWLVKGDASQCRTYRLPWMIRENGAYREPALDVRDAPCPANR